MKKPKPVVINTAQRRYRVSAIQVDPDGVSRKTVVMKGHDYEIWFEFLPESARRLSAFLLEYADWKDGK